MGGDGKLKEACLGRKCTNPLVPVEEPNVVVPAVVVPAAPVVVEEAQEEAKYQRQPKTSTTPSELVLTNWLASMPSLQPLPSSPIDDTQLPSTYSTPPELVLVKTTTSTWNYATSSDDYVTVFSLQLLQTDVPEQSEDQVQLGASSASPPPPASTAPADSEDMEVETEVDVSSILGFARARNAVNYFPARRLGDLGPSFYRVQYFGTGVVSVVTRQQWLPYSEDVRTRILAGASQNKATLALGLEELLAAKAKIERDGVDELDFVSMVHQASTSTSNTTKEARGVARQLTKLSRVSVQHSERLTAAAMSRYMVEQEGGLFLCRECPNFKTDNLVVANRHARGHGQPKKKTTKRSTEKIHLCSKPGCGQKFARVTECDLHYQTKHQVMGGGYRCWPCSTTRSKPVEFKNWKYYVQHLRATKLHNPAVELKHCPYCEHSTCRSYNMQTHIGKRHGPQVMVLSILNDILTEIVESHVDLEAVEDLEQETETGTVAVNLPETVPDHQIEHLEEVVDSGEMGYYVEAEDDPDEEMETGAVAVILPKTVLDDQIEHLEEVAGSGEMSDYEEMKLINLRQRRQVLINLGLVMDNPGPAQPRLRKRRWGGGGDSGGGVVMLRRSSRNKRKSPEDDETARLREIDGGEEVEQDMEDMDIEEGEQMQELSVDLSEGEPEQGDPDYEQEQTNPESDYEDEEVRTDSEDDDPPGYGFVCDICGDYGTNRLVNLVRHVSDVHSPRNYSILCTRCDKEFATYSEMTQHRNSCILFCRYPNCTWYTTRRKRMPGHERRHLDRIRRMTD